MRQSICSRLAAFALFFFIVRAQEGEAPETPWFRLILGRFKELGRRVCALALSYTYSRVTHPSSLFKYNRALQENNTLKTLTRLVFNDCDPRVQVYVDQLQSTVF